MRSLEKEYINFININSELVGREPFHKLIDDQIYQYFDTSGDLSDIHSFSSRRKNHEMTVFITVFKCCLFYVNWYIPLPLCY